MENFVCLLVILIVCVLKIQLSDTSPLQIDKDIRSSPYSFNPDFGQGHSDLVYSDVSSQQQEEARERIYRQLRQYGVPSDVAQMYVPRGMTVGELLGKDTPNNSDGDDENDLNSTFDPWSIVWYIGSFGGLIAFFLVISCSEWCCLKSRNAAAIVSATVGTTTTTTTSTTRCPATLARGAPHPQPQPTPDTPPPGYHLFAPPSYDVVFDKDETKEKRMFDVYVVPVHSVPHVRGGCLEGSPPPQYTEIDVTPT